MVGVTGFEPAASWSQTKRATSCATPRDLMKIKIIVKPLENAELPGNSKGRLFGVDEGT